MPNFNHVTIIGNAVRDPEYKDTSGGSGIVIFTVAVNASYKTKAGEEKKSVDYIDCKAFGRTAEVIRDYVTKGNPVFVSGKLKLEQWETQGGEKRSKLLVYVDGVQLLGGRQSAPVAPEAFNDDGFMGEPVSNPKPHAKGNYRPIPTGKTRPQGSPISEQPEFADSDIPF